MRIWHDNSGKGKFGSWYLNYVLIRDIQTREKYYFIVNQWLAVEEDDGQVCCTSSNNDEQ
jgi:polycystin 1L2